MDLISDTIKFDMSVRSRVGGGLTLLLGVSVILVASLCVRSFVSRDNPISNYQITTEAASLDLGQSGYLPAVLLYYNDSTLLIEPSEVAKFVSVVVFKDVVYFDGRKERREFDVVSCEAASKEGDQYGYIEKYETVRKYGLCVGRRGLEQFRLDTNLDRYLRNGNNGWDQQSLNIEIKPCVLGSQCKVESEVELVSVQVVLPEVSLNLRNFGNPVRLDPILQGNIHKVRSNVTTEIEHVLQKVKVEDYIGILPRWSETSESIKQKESIFSVYERQNNSVTCGSDYAQLGTSCSSYVSHKILSGSSSILYSRKHATIVDFLAQIGGFKEILLLIFIALYSRYQSNLRDDLLIEKVYGFLNDPLLHKSQVQKANEGQNQLLAKSRSSLCCKKKHDTLEKQRKALRNKALQAIENNLQITNLLQEINMMRIISSLMLKERNKTLVPILSLDSSFINLPDTENPAVNRRSTRNSEISPSHTIVEENFTEKQDEPFSAFTAKTHRSSLNKKFKSKISMKELLTTPTKKPVKSTFIPAIKETGESHQISPKSQSISPFHSSERNLSENCIHDFVDFHLYRCINNIPDDFIRSMLLENSDDDKNQDECAIENRGEEIQYPTRKSKISFRMDRNSKNVIHSESISQLSPTARNKTILKKKSKFLNEEDKGDEREFQFEL